jgi:hypothetical protein
MSDPAQVTEYKFVETSVVTDETLERIVNEWVGAGWQLDGIHFVIAPTSKRPVMAFIAFTRIKQS